MWSQQLKCPHFFSDLPSKAGEAICASVCSIPPMASFRGRLRYWSLVKCLSDLAHRAAPNWVVLTAATCSISQRHGWLSSIQPLNHLRRLLSR